MSQFALDCLAVDAVYNGWPPLKLISGEGPFLVAASAIVAELSRSRKQARFSVGKWGEAGAERKAMETRSRKVAELLR
jgi:hypothetical protein